MTSNTNPDPTESAARSSSLASASSACNFELFLHVPFAIASALSKNQRFEEARRWFHYVFDPTDASPQKEQFRAAIAQWKADPFKPHVVARLRLRAYMLAVVMKYIENLLDWADQLFRRDTTESNNEATQLYVLAAQIFGRRPEGIPRRTRPILMGFTEFSAARPDDLTNALVEAESLIPPGTATGSGAPAAAGSLLSLYFCLPANPKLEGLYDRVEDRLFKLRNSINIDGVGHRRR